MPLRKSGVSRREFAEKVVNSEKEMKREEDDLKVYASDFQEERGTRESLDLQGAEEDSREVDEALVRAEDITTERFGEHDQQLEGLQRQNEEIESDFRQRRESVDSDVKKLQKTKLDSMDAINAMVQAKESALRGEEFLREQMEKTRVARESSEQAQKELQTLVNATRGGGGK